MVADRAVAVVAIAALMVTVYRRNTIGWLVDRARWRRRRRRSDLPAAAIDIPHGASLYGVRVADRFDGEAITMIEVTGQAYSPTLLTGSATALTPNLLAARRADGSARSARRHPPVGHRRGVEWTARAPRHRLPAAVFHPAGRPSGRGAAPNISGGAPRHREFGDRPGLPIDGRRGRGGGHRTHRERATAARCAR